MKKIILKRIKLNNFQNWKELEYEFDEKLEMIIAPYGSGKTTIYNGFLYALGIDLPSGVEVVTKNNLLDIPNDLIATSIIDLIIDDELYTFERNSNNKFKINGEKITTLKKYNECVENIIGIDKSLFTLLTKIETFNQETPKWKWNNRLEFLKKLFDIETKLNDLKGNSRLANYFKNGKNETEIKNYLAKEKRNLNSEKSYIANLYEEANKELYKVKNRTIDTNKTNKITSLQQEKINLLNQHNELFEELMEVMNKDLVAPTKCETCGRELPKEDIEKYKDLLKKSRDDEKQMLEAKIETLNQKMSNIDLQIKNITETDFTTKEIEYIENSINNYKNKILELTQKETSLALDEEALKEYLVKSKSIIESINMYFDYGISFKLFNEKEDGTFDSECVMMLDGKLYDCLSFGERIYANLLITQYLQKYYDIQLPLFVDNTNAFKFTELNTQTILLITKENECNLTGIKATDYYGRKEK